ncbi:hypothetical protein [Streptomyces aureoverticillatus]|uniref:hypothetical protein n=1 Tax=Streptomyces aureoverticillatus TaxID=66871 RepID=UPI0013DC7BCF|nr:hypothetical protein [Streptomyces aureoverticillatus]QIB47741.1 hypothetical protein G3H79_36345 [Streptomyces aureoverticillatus]
MAWGAALVDFGWRRTTALPRCLAGRFRQEPSAVVLGWTRVRPELSPRDPEFGTGMVTLAAAPHGVAKDRRIGEDVRQYRRARRRVLLAVLAGEGASRRNVRQDKAAVSYLKPSALTIHGVLPATARWGRTAGRCCSAVRERTRNRSPTPCVTSSRAKAP